MTVTTNGRRVQVLPVVSFHVKCLALSAFSHAANKGVAKIYQFACLFTGVVSFSLFLTERSCLLETQKSEIQVGGWKA